MLAMCARKRIYRANEQRDYGCGRSAEECRQCGEGERKHTVAEQGHRLGPTLGSLLEGVELHFRGAFARFADSSKLPCDRARCRLESLLWRFTVWHRREYYAMDAASRGATCGAERRSRASGVAAQRRLVQVREARKALALTAAISLESPQTR